MNQEFVLQNKLDIKAFLNVFTDIGREKCRECHSGE